MTDTAIKARISGRVQGVGFRAWTQTEARSLGLAGWVRNEDDGTVTAVLAGPEGRVGDMVGLLHHGPAGAQVEDVATEAAEPPGGDDFRVAG